MHFKNNPPEKQCRMYRFSGADKRVVSKRVVLADVPLERKPERGYIRMFPQNEKRNEGTFACSLGTKTGTRVHSPKPPFYETALLSPSEYRFSALGKWGRTQMGSDGFNRILSGFYLLDLARVRPVPSKTHDFKGFRPDFNRILTGL